jgi:flagellar biogenesis protein FliO
MFSPIALLQVEPALTNESAWGDYLKVVILLAVLLCLAYLVLRYGRRRLFRLRTGPDGTFELIDRFALEPRRRLYLVRVSTQYLVLAASEKGVTLLTKLDPKDRMGEPS